MKANILMGSVIVLLLVLVGIRFDREQVKYKWQEGPENNIVHYCKVFQNRKPLRDCSEFTKEELSSMTTVSDKPEGI